MGYLQQQFCNPSPFKIVIAEQYKPRMVDMQSHIVDVVCSVLKIKKHFVMNGSRMRESVDARQIAMVIIYNRVPGATFKKIGKYFNKHHAMAIHARKCVANMRDTDMEYAANYTEILRQIERRLPCN